jgi:hypothetical protein
MSAGADCAAQCTSQWALAAATIGAGAIVAVVAVAVTWLVQRSVSAREAARIDRETESARKALLRRQLEALVASVDEWVGAREAYVTRIAAHGFRRTLGRSPPEFDRTSGPSALDRAAAICELYFPELDADLLQLRLATLAHTEYTSKEVALLREHPETWLRDHAVGFTQRGADSSRALGDARMQIARRARQLVAERLMP